MGMNQEGFKQITGIWDKISEKHEQNNQEKNKEQNEGWKLQKNQYNNQDQTGLDWNQNIYGRIK